MRPDLSVVMSAGVFGRLLRASLGRLGGSWGPSWGLLAAPLRPWAAPGASWGLWAAPGCFLTASWRLPGASGRLLGTFWDPSGRVLGASWGLLGSSWGPLGALWAAPWALHKTLKNRVFYVILGLRGLFWRPLGMAALGWLLGSLGPSWAGLCVFESVLSDPVEFPDRHKLSRPAELT